MAEVSLVKLPRGECHLTLLMTSQLDFGNLVPLGTGHNPGQCRPRSMSPHGVTRPQLVKFDHVHYNDARLYRVFTPYRACELKICMWCKPCFVAESCWDKVPMHQCWQFHQNFRLSILVSVRSNTSVSSWKLAVDISQLLYSWWRHQMETFFSVTGHLCAKFTGDRWIPHTKARDAELWCFLWSASE